MKCLHEQAGLSQQQGVQWLGLKSGSRVRRNISNLHIASSDPCSPMKNKPAERESFCLFSTIWRVIMIMLIHSFHFIKP